MKMTVTMENVTADKAITFLTALEVSKLLPELSINVEQAGMPDPALEEPVETSAEEPSQFDTIELKMGTFLGFDLDKIWDTWTSLELDENPYDVHQAIPALGFRRRDNLLTRSEALEALGWNLTRIRNACDQGHLSVLHSGPAYSRRYYMTFEQVVILKFASYICWSYGMKHMTKRILTEATSAFLATYPDYQRSVNLRQIRRSTKTA